MDRSRLAPNETFWPLDCSDYDKVLAAVQGVDAVVHLAADPSGDAEFESLLPRNIIAAYNIFNAAAAAGCSRVVMASTTQVMNGYGGADSPERRERGIGNGGVPWDAPVAPTNLYGASKAWGEALARVYSTSHGLSCICVRLGGFQLDGQVFDEEAKQRQVRFCFRPLCWMHQLDMLGTVLLICGQMWYRCTTSPHEMRRRSSGGLSMLHRPSASRLCPQVHTQSPPNFDVRRLLSREVACGYRGSPSTVSRFRTTHIRKKCWATSRRTEPRLITPSCD